MRRMVEVAAVLTLATTTLVLSSCTAPSQTTHFPEEVTRFFTRPPAEGFDVMVRDVPLGAERAATAVIGPEGGRLEIADAGVALVVPPSALDRPVELTLRALAGEAVAFEFAPHGLTFARPAEVHVRAEGTPAATLLGGAASRTGGSALAGFMGVYFEGDPALGVEPLETLETYLRDDAIVFEIDHFSGYACASG